MFCSTFFKFIFIFNAVGISFVVADSARKEIIDILLSYPKIMDLYLNPDHPLYLPGYNILRETINPPSNKRPDESSSSGARAPDIKVLDLFIFLFNMSLYDEIKVLLRNSIASVCCTYMHRFCAYALEMNTRKANLSPNLVQFNKLLISIQETFRILNLPTGYIDQILGIYNLYNPVFFQTGYTVPNKGYRDYLENYMETIKRSIFFVKLECYDQSAMGQLDLKDLNKHQLKEIRNARKLLLKASVDTNIPTGIQTGRSGILDGRSCTICFDDFNVDDDILSLPCGHTDICINCKNLEHCPICRRECKKYINVNIMKPLSSIRGRDIWERIPRNLIDQEARCVSCNGQVQLTNKMIAYPCGHGLYCQKCSTRQKCRICDIIIDDIIKIYF